MRGVDAPSRALTLGALCWLAGLAVAVGYGHGFELQRMVAAVPFLALAAVLVLPGFLRSGGLWGPALIALVLAVIYFAVRIVGSPVWDLARTDLLLLSMGLLSVVVGASLGSSQRALLCLLGGLVVLLLANAVVAVVQLGDPAYAFLRKDRVDQSGPSGFFWHRNYFAGMLELMVPVFLAVAIVVRQKSLQVPAAVLTAAGLLLGYLSHSRGGLLAIGVGCAAVVFVRLQCGWRTKSWNSRLGLTIGAAVVGLGVVVGAVVMASKVSERRGQDELVEAALMRSGARLALAGCAYDQWQEDPVVGNGAGTYSYLVVRNFEGGSSDSSLGNPKYAHNDYLQTLAEYGLLGFGFVGLVLCLGLARGGRQVLAAWSEGGNLMLAVRLGAVGGLCAAMVHSGVDYPLRILPNTVLFGLLLGVVLSTTRDGSSGGSSLPRPLAGLLTMVLAGAGVVGAVGAGYREIGALPKWIALEQGAIRDGHFRGRRAELKELIDRAPHFELARLHGRMVMGELRGAGDERDSLLAEGIGAMDVAVARHPFDAESRLVRANFLELAGDDEGAERDYLEGIAATWRRENKYGGMAAFSDYLARRAEGQFQAREPGRALALFKRALEYRERSWDAGFRAGGWQVDRPIHLKKIEFLQGRIDFLTGARVEPVELEHIPPPPTR